MERIYFDKQIFSGANSVYQNFLLDLYNNKYNFLYCYSHGHLLDLKNDKNCEQTQGITKSGADELL